MARVVDNMGGKQTANLLNFAEIRLDRHKMLGHGSFSKVYRFEFIYIFHLSYLFIIFNMIEEHIEILLVRLNLSLQLI